jgi:phosphopantetheinyl transferase (holo-ACP synthase)
MVGEGRLEPLVAYLSRLTGETLTADQPVRLRSVQRAALASWSRKQGLPIRFKLIIGSAPFTVRALLGEDASAMAAAVAAPGPSPRLGPGLTTGVFAGIGIDIEETAELPLADDYREHPFYQDNFTPAEIAYCIRQANARAAFSGTWAAKEAVLKSGLFTAPTGRLDGIEIDRDTLGRPAIPGGYLSISHTATTSVAVCIALAPTAGEIAAPTEFPDASRAPMNPAGRPAVSEMRNPATARRRGVLIAACCVALMSCAVSVAVYIGL